MEKTLIRGTASLKKPFRRLYTLCFILGAILLALAVFAEVVTRYIVYPILTYDAYRALSSVGYFAPLFLLIGIVLLVISRVIRKRTISQELVVTTERVYGRTKDGYRIEVPVDAITIVANKDRDQSVTICTNSAQMEFVRFENYAAIHKTLNEYLRTRKAPKETPRRERTPISKGKKLAIVGILLGAFVLLGLIIYFVIYPFSARANGKYHVLINMYNVEEFEVPEGTQVIYADAFRDCDSLVRIVLPDSVSRIANGAFDDCTNLTSITLGHGLRSISDDTFGNCDKLVEIVNRSSISCFPLRSSAENIIEVPVGDSRLYKENGVWYYIDFNYQRYIVNYTGLSRNPVLYSNTASLMIAPCAFYNNARIRSVTIGRGVVSIGENAFRHCESLTEVTIGSDVQRIHDNAFTNCPKLSTVLLRESVESIGSGAFWGCGRLKTVYYVGNAYDYQAITVGVSNEPLGEAELYYYSTKKPTVNGNFWHYVDDEIVVWE